MNEYEKIKISALLPFADNPFKERDGEELELLTESIKENGVLEPLIVRPVGRSQYEIVSGHRRYAVCKALGMTEVPAVIKEMNREEALIAVVDSNLHRDGLLPSEKAFAYRMKLDAQKALLRQSAQPVHRGKSRDTVAEEIGTSRETIRRYIRLTYLIKPLLDLVDAERIALTPAVELSYLPKGFQQDIAQVYEADEITPSYSQAVYLRKAYEDGTLTQDKLYAVLSEPKPNQKEYIRLDSEKYSKFLGKFRSVKEKEDFVAKAMEYYHKYLLRQREAR